MDDETTSAESPDSHDVISTRQAYDSLKKKHSRSQREVRRLRASVSFLLGLHITNAARQPWRLPFLPISLPLLAVKLGLQRIGHRPTEESLSIEQSVQIEREHCIVLFPTNGVGFGHFTRMYAVARALRKADPTLEIVFFTPMPTLHVLYSEEFPTYHLAGRYKHVNMSATQWNGLVEDMLHMVFDMHRPKWFMFDGAFPYRGMLNAIASQPHMNKWWMRRGSLKKNKSIPVDSQSFFDGIIVPSEGQEIGSEEGVHVVAPIKAIEVGEAWDRAFARSRLSIPAEGKAVYVQLGAGRINDIESLLEKVLHSLFDHSEVYVVLGESMLGERLNFTHERLRVVRDYPNALYALAFDASVQAGGYNSYQEMRMFGIPTLFIPNTDTGMDDQVARCRVAEEEGWGLVNMEESRISVCVHSLLQIPPNKPLKSKNGSEGVARLVLNSSKSFTKKVPKGDGV
tara:strand:+ start:1426 stop:2793 length:1368 start_codon:yes stop_codon:yes gene_type:complete